MKNRKFVIVSSIYFVSLLLLAVVFILGYMGIITNEYLSTFLIQIVVMFAVPTLMYTVFVSKNVKTTFKDLGFKKISGKTLGYVLLLGVILYVLNTFVANVFSGIISLLGYESLATSQTITINYELLLKEFILSAVLPGFCEEILHRGVMLHGLKKHSSPRYCLIISSIMFGLSHMNINQFFYTAILGAMMGYVSLCTDSIFPAMILHFMNNFLSNYFYYGSYLKLPFTELFNSFYEFISQSLLLYCVATLIMIPSLIYFYYLIVKQLVKERRIQETKKIINCLKLNQLTLIEAKIKIEETNKILAQNYMLRTDDKTKPTLLEKTFVIGAIIIGASITIFTFVWGIM